MALLDRYRRGVTMIGADTSTFRGVARTLQGKEIVKMSSDEEEIMLWYGKITDDPDVTYASITDVKTGEVLQEHRPVHESDRLPGDPIVVVVWYQDLSDKTQTFSNLDEAKAWLAIKIAEPGDSVSAIIHNYDTGVNEYEWRLLPSYALPDVPLRPMGTIVVKAPLPDVGIVNVDTGRAEEKGGGGVAVAAGLGLAGLLGLFGLKKKTKRRG